MGLGPFLGDSSEFVNHVHACYCDMIWPILSPIGNRSRSGRKQHQCCRQEEMQKRGGCGCTDRIGTCNKDRFDDTTLFVLAEKRPETWVVDTDDSIKSGWS